MQIKSKLGLGGALVIAALGGCGSSSSNGGGGQFTTSVPSGTMLSSLTSAQAMQLCTDLTNYAKGAGAATATNACKVSGITAAALLAATGTPTDAQVQAACTSTYNSCLSADGGTTSTTCNPSSIMNQPATCTSTVGDLTMCTNMEVAIINQDSSKLPACSSLTAATALSALSTLAGPDGGAGLSATCQALQSNCNTM